MANRDIRRSVEGRGRRRGAYGIQDGCGIQQGLSGRKAGNLKEVGLGWINGVEKIILVDGER